jgi:cytoskeletal protein CcmA (bactofilin family)
MVAVKGVRRRPIVLALVICALVLVSAPGAMAAEVSTGKDVHVAAGETVPDDVYAQASQVTIDGTVYGDLVALADDVVINGDVDGSVWTLARTVQVNGRVMGSVHAIAISLAMGPPAEVNRDVVVGGYSVTTAPGSTIQGDVWAWTYQAQLAGSIGRNYVGRHAGLELDGRIGGNAQVEVGAPTSNTSFNPAYVLPDVGDVPTVAPGLSVSNQADIAGGLSVQSGETPAVAPDTLHEFMTSILNLARGLVPLLLTCALLLRFWPTQLVMAAKTVTECPGASLGWGIVLVVGVLLAAYCVAILALSAGAICAAAGVPSLAVVTAGAAGVSVVSVLLAVFVIGAWVSKVVCGVAMASWVLRRFGRTPVGRPVRESVIGTLAAAVIVAVTASIPVVGLTVGSLIGLVGLGACLLQSGYVLRPPFGVQSVSPRSAA